MKVGKIILRLFWIIENKISLIDGVKDVIVVSGKDKEHEGFQKSYLFLVAEECVL